MKEQCCLTRHFSGCLYAVSSRHSGSPSSEWPTHFLGKFFLIVLLFSFLILKKRCASSSWPCLVSFKC